MRINIGNRIEKWRVKNGMTQMKLADVLNVSRQSVSKWELGHSIPDVEKIVQMAKIWEITTDDILLDEKPQLLEPSKHILNWGMYLVVKDFKKSVHFYEQLLNRKATIVGTGRFAQFRFNGNCILSIMSQNHIPGHDVTHTYDYKFALNLWTIDLGREWQRIRSLNIGPFTDITSYHPTYYFFNLVDPDYNLVEITGEFHESGVL